MLRLPSKSIVPSNLTYVVWRDPSGGSLVGGGSAPSALYVPVGLPWAPTALLVCLAVLFQSHGKAQPLFLPCAPRRPVS